MSLTQTSRGPDSFHDITSEILVRKDTLMAAALCPSPSSCPMVTPDWGVHFKLTSLISMSLSQARAHGGRKGPCRENEMNWKHRVTWQSFKEHIPKLSLLNWQIRAERESRTSPSSGFDSNNSANVLLNSLFSSVGSLSCSEAVDCVKPVQSNESGCCLCDVNS